ncbi:hypothetical protein B0G71_4507 [Paraburkholderia sp. BL27I4N3]|nr:hypothetical protein B0G71_4507 [Paraburkholderia sp. BL27I4N3]
MKPARLLRWCIGSLAVWFALGTAFAWGSQQLSFEIPLWLADFVRWLLRSLYPDWTPDAYDIEAWTNSLLIVSGYLIAAVVVGFISVFASKRLSSRR